MRSLIAILLSAVAGLYVGCTEFQEGDTIITLTGAAAPTVETTGGSSVGGSIELDPPNFTVAVSKNANVRVIVRDGAGQEVATENLTADPIDSSIVALVDKTDRTLTFEGLVVGTTPIIISANGLQTATTGTVIP